MTALSRKGFKEAMRRRAAAYKKPVKTPAG
jgi:hypothetical protein